MSIKREICETKCKKTEKWDFIEKNQVIYGKTSAERAGWGGGTVFQKEVSEWDVKTGKKFRSGK